MKTQITKFFGESAYFIFNDKEDEEKAIQYLKYWKKNLLNKFTKQTIYSPKIIDEMWVDTPPMYINPLCEYAIKGLKVCIEINFDDELLRYDR